MKRSLKVIRMRECGLPEPKDVNKFTADELKDYIYYLAGALEAKAEKEQVSYRVVKIDIVFK